MESIQEEDEHLKKKTKSNGNSLTRQNKQHINKNKLTSSFHGSVKNSGMVDS